MRDRRGIEQQPSEYEEKVLQIKRVSKKTRGGNNIGFTALVVIGNKNGKVGSGYGKAKDVSTAVTKGVAQAKKDLMTINLVGTTIAHEVKSKYGSATVLLKPAPKGAGIIAGGPIRVVVELAGIKDVSAKMIGANNKICNVRCTLDALRKLKG